MRIWRVAVGAAAALCTVVPLRAQEVVGELLRADVQGEPVMLHVHMRVRFTPDGRDVAAADSAGYVEALQLRRDGSTRLVRVAGTPSGRLERTFRVAGAPAPYDSSAAAVLARGIRESGEQMGLTQQPRLRQVWREQGFGAALDAAAPRPPSYSAGYHALVDDSALTPADLSRLILRVAPAPAEGSELRWLLPAALRAPVAQADSVRARLVAALGLLSPRERSELLRDDDVIQAAEGEQGRAAYFEQLRRLDLDDQRVLVLFAMVERRETSAGLLARGLDFTATLSPADRARVLTAVPARRLMESTARAAYLRVLASMPPGPERDAAAAHLQGTGAPSAGGAR